MGRLDDIIDRNKHPGKHRQTRFPVGIMLSAFVLLILVLMIFTDAAISPGDKDKATATPAPSGEKRVNGVMLYRDKTVRDAGLGSAPNTAPAPTPPAPPPR